MSKILNTSLLAIVLTATTSIAFADGKATYEQVCSACHASGVAGSPKFGDVTDWAPRIAKGKLTLYTTALNGKGAMPAKGGVTTLSDAEVKAAVDYMVSSSSKL